MVTTGRFGTLLIGLASSALLLGVVPGSDTAPSTVSVPVQLVVSTAPTKAQARADVITAVNAERRRAGCAALASDSRLTKAAQGHAGDMAANNYFSHTGRNGSTFGDRIRATGATFRTGGENIAKGQRSAAAVMASWMASSGHRRNILNCAFTRIGVGFDARGNYWVQDFTG